MTLNNAYNYRTVYRKTLGESKMSSSSFCETTNHPYCTFCEFGIVAPFSIFSWIWEIVSIIRSTLSIHIPHVVPLGPQKQMRWVYATRSIAAVKNKKILWDLSIAQCPRQTMRPNGRRTPSARTYESISKRIFRAKPNPTLVSFFDTVPKSFLNRNLWLCHRISILT